MVQVVYSIIKPIVGFKCEYFQAILLWLIISESFAVPQIIPVKGVLLRWY